jgi:hypothetical protein
LGSREKSYFRYYNPIKLKGCYDSVGVTTNHSLFSERNGTTSDGWAVRLYGSHSDVSFTGAIHNNENIKFFSNW